MIVQARKIPLSPFEQKMVALDAAEPDDESEVDVLLILEAVLQQQFAYKVWAELDTWLKDSAREALLAWGREQAVVMNKEVQYVALPERVRKV